MKKALAVLLALVAQAHAMEFSEQEFITAVMKVHTGGIATLTAENTAPEENNPQPHLTLYKALFTNPELSETFLTKTYKKIRNTAIFTTSCSVAFIAGIATLAFTDEQWMPDHYRNLLLALPTAYTITGATASALGITRLMKLYTIHQVNNYFNAIKSWNYPLPAQEPAALPHNEPEQSTA